MAKAELQNNFLINLGRFIEAGKRADSKTVWELAQHFENPETFYEDFSEPHLHENKWPVTLINFDGGVVKPFSFDERVADIQISDGSLKLSIDHDPEFDKKSYHWRKGQAAAPQYNNAYITGAGGFMPTPEEAILITVQMKVDENYPGSTGIWVEEQRTFNPSTGVMEKPFRSAGFAWLGDSSAKFFSGLTLQTCVGMAPQDIVKIKELDPHDWHEYQMLWRWKDPSQQEVACRIDHKPLWMLPVAPFGPGELQLWADNYRVTNMLQLRYVNPNTHFESAYRDIKVEPVSLP